MLADVTGLPVKLLHAAHNGNAHNEDGKVMNAEITTLGVLHLMEASLLKKKRDASKNAMQNLLLSDDKAMEVQDAAHELHPREGWRDYYAYRKQQQDVLYNQIFDTRGGA